MDYLVESIGASEFCSVVFSSIKCGSIMVYDLLLKSFPLLDSCSGLVSGFELELLEVLSGAE